MNPFSGMMAVNIMLRSGHTVGAAMSEADAKELIKQWRLRTIGEFIYGNSPVTNPQHPSLSSKTWDWCVRTEDVVAIHTAFMVPGQPQPGWQGGFSGG